MQIYQYPSDAADAKLDQIKSRGLEFSQKELAQVEAILKDVRENGDEALLRYTHQFDAPTITWNQMVVTEEELDLAEGQASVEFKRALERAAAQIEHFHKKQLPRSWWDTPRQGVMLGQIVQPVERAGLYIPGGMGGNTPLISSVLMCGIPAKLAGVKDITMVSPPRKDGSLDPHLLCAARRAGVNRIIKLGSAWAIAALAYGTETVSRVDVIVGPGNIFVTLAKKLVIGTVGIDMIAGPSEILVLADDSANPEFVAADLLSQAEHDPKASAVLVTTSQAVAEKTSVYVKEQLAQLARADLAQKSLDDFGAILVVKDLDEAFALANNIAPEHLELVLDDPLTHIDRIKNAGAVFIGNYTPEAVGDYVAGTNHVLPTVGTARFASALNVENFMKKTSVIRYSKAAFEQEADDTALLANLEGLDAHARSVTIRQKNE